MSAAAAIVAEMTRAPQYVCTGCDRLCDSVSISDVKDVDQEGKVKRLQYASCPTCGEPVRRNVGWRRT